MCIYFTCTNSARAQKEMDWYGSIILQNTGSAKYKTQLILHFGFENTAYFLQPATFRYVGRKRVREVTGLEVRLTVDWFKHYLFCYD